MSGDRPPKPGPAPFSQAEIEALTAGRRPAAITRRLRAVKTPAARPPAPGALEQPGPSALKPAELAMLRKGRPTASLRKRLFTPAVESPSHTPPESGGGKPYPSQLPPGRDERS